MILNLQSGRRVCTKLGIVKHIIVVIVNLPRRDIN
jgi:hypothetical protein